MRNLIAGRGELAAGVIPPSLPGGDKTRIGYAFDTAQRQAAARARRAIPNGIDVELWTSTNPIYVRIAETLQAYLKLSGIRAKLVQRESAAAREAARKGETDMILKDWYADYPGRRELPLSAAAQREQGRGRQRVVLRERRSSTRS